MQIQGSLVTEHARARSLTLDFTCSGASADEAPNDATADELGRPSIRVVTDPGLGFCEGSVLPSLSRRRRTVVHTRASAALSIHIRASGDDAGVPNVQSYAFRRHDLSSEGRTAR